MKALFAGIDVQTSRGCPFALLDDRGSIVANGWILDQELDEFVELLQRIKQQHHLGNQQVHAGIDAPRMPLFAGRVWQWKADAWQSCAPRPGRHCEIAVRALGLANPQWTPLAPDAPEWMRLGFKLFERLQQECQVHEVFPSAAYTMLAQDVHAQVTVHLGHMKPGPKDMLDAHVAAFTVREFAQGRGCEVGGGDGQGTIVLPRPIATGEKQGFLRWPSS